MTNTALAAYAAPATSDIAEALAAEQPNSGQVIVVDFARASTPHSALATEIAQLAADRLAAPKKQGGLKDYAVNRTDIFNVNPYVVEIKAGLNSRDMTDPANQAHIDRLARSIAKNGVLEALRVFYEDGHTYVSNGECRLLATFRAIEVYGARVLTIPVRTEGRSPSALDLIASQIVANDGKGFTPFEMAEAFKKAMALGATLKEVADMAALSTVRVTQLLELRAGATPEIKEMVKTGKITPSLAWKTIKSSKGNSTKALQTLQDAYQNARAAGRDRASPKHVMLATTEPYKVSRKAVAELIRSATKVRQADGSMQITFGPSTYTALSKLLGL